MKLSIIVPTKGRKAILGATLAAVIQSTRQVEAEIIVVNDSTTDIPNVPFHDNLVVLNNPKSGVAAARNFGFLQSTGDLILFLDNDIIISKESVEHILNLHADGAPACYNLNWEYSPDTLKELALNPFTRFLERFQMINFKGWYDDPSWKDNELFRSKSVASFHLSILRRDFAKTGGYNEAFPLAGFEDYDFPLRLKKAGINFYIDSRVTVCHNEVDRLNLDNWLNNQEARALTRRKAVSLGYDELALHYGLGKKLALHFFNGNEVFFRRMLRNWPNIEFSDPLYFRILGALQAAKIYKGYTCS